uniref:Uncharacterized protein n=1 Tax=Octopus bimaculoides TaxID=37653 RepID=A0A0L8H4A1_OCTBM
MWLRQWQDQSSRRASYGDVFAFSNLPSIITMQTTSPVPTKTTYQSKLKGKFDHLPNI